MKNSEKNYQIIIEGFQLYAYHGVHPEENKLGQVFEIDLTMTLESPPLNNDQPGSYLSYWEAMKTIKKVFDGKIFKLLENAAQAVLDSLSEYPQMKHAKIHLKKIAPPIPVTVKCVGVVMEREY
jgi:dihydroneopterin aldolase